MHAGKFMFSVIMIWLGFGLTGYSQSCFEINAILVDACGNPEGENEMVKFTIGPNNLSTMNLFVDWPNNAYLGICQDPTTANQVAQINSTITGCGLLVEPVGGILPAGAEVILVTSTNFNPSANSFANLNDTVYIIFQCQGNTSGHFANATSSGTRNLELNFGPGCTDAVSYNCGNLVDVFGNTGTTGSQTDRDGSTVVYDNNGNATYINNGCSAPVAPMVIDAGTDEVVCVGDTISLTGNYNGVYSSVSWTGGNGTWINANQFNANYIVSPFDYPLVNLFFNVTNCNGTLTDSLFLLQGSVPVIHPPLPGPFEICPGMSLSLDAGPDGPYMWNTGETTQQINITAPGIYYVNSVNGCGQISDTVFFTVTQQQIIASFTADSMQGVAPLTVNFTNQSSGASIYNWLFDDDGTSQDESPQYTFMFSGNYLVTLIASNQMGCSDTAEMNIQVLECNSNIFIPNSFTPNGDEINNFFNVFSTCTYTAKVTIFNRWGQEVYSYTHENWGWDGNFVSGNPMPVGVYVYLVEINDLNGESHTFRGQLNLLR